MKSLCDGSNENSFESIDPLPTISDHVGDEAVFWPARPLDFPRDQGRATAGKIFDFSRHAIGTFNYNTSVSQRLNGVIWMVASEQ